MEQTVDCKVEARDGLLVVHFGDYTVEIEPMEAQKLQLALQLGQAKLDIPKTFRIRSIERKES
jgi:ribosomal protein L16/L10AE